MKTRLYLITPVLDAVAPFLPALNEALMAGDVACVLLRLASRDPGTVKKMVQAAAPSVQGAGAALLIEGDPQLVARCGADGLHVMRAAESMANALETLKPDFIVGVGPLESRDDCMNAGEAGADYVMFGASDDSALERTQWWAEIFNVPCVAVAASLADVADLVAANADFIAPGDWLWTQAGGVDQATRAVQNAINSAMAGKANA